jgi:hypothetical protein
MDAGRSFTLGPGSARTRGPAWTEWGTHLSDLINQRLRSVGPTDTAAGNQRKSVNDRHPPKAVIAGARLRLSWVESGLATSDVQCRIADTDPSSRAS